MAGRGLEPEFKIMTSHTLNRLSATRVASIKDPGRHADGGGVYLFVDTTRRRWLFRYTWHGTKMEVGLGSARTLSLAKAREVAAEYRGMVAEGLNPKTRRDKEKQDSTFGTFADEYVEAMSTGWKNAKHIAQWKMTLSRILHTYLGAGAVHLITSASLIAPGNPEHFPMKLRELTAQRRSRRQHSADHIGKYDLPLDQFLDTRFEPPLPTSPTFISAQFRQYRRD
jgi:hypothetical protein